MLVVSKGNHVPIAILIKENDESPTEHAAKVQTEKGDTILCLDGLHTRELSRLSNEVRKFSLKGFENYLLEVKNGPFSYVCRI